MNNCDGKCDTCKTECINKCPICNATATQVPIETVKSLCNIEINSNEDIYMCLNKKCNIAYFNKEIILKTEDVNVPIWFKVPVNEMIVCYCYNITLLDIVNAVKKYNVYTKEEIINKLNKQKQHKDCLHLNPIGKECDKLFENAIEYAKGVN